ncbi:MAG TPA: glycosyltransferase [Candidatus Acidoferrum sp.]|nr:glycosyltransferase [Candidatus Acidoferrum sp.]
MATSVSNAAVPSPVAPPAAGVRRRVLLVATHVVQYASPLYRLLASDPRLDFQVAYCSLQGAEAGVDPEFGREVKWDLPLLEGYRWVQVRNRARRPGLGRFFGLRNPGLWKLIRGGEFDVVVLCTGYMLASHWIALAAARSKGIPVIFSSDTSVIESRDQAGWKGAIKPAILGWAYRSADVLMVISRAGREVALRVGMPASRIARVRSVMDKTEWQARAAGFDREACRDQWGIPHGAPVAFYCAKLQEWKRPLDLVHAFAEAAVPGAYLVLAGDGPQREEVEKAVSALGIAASVRLLGFVNTSQLPGCYRAADILVLPSRYDPCPFVVPEAMFSGTPVILSDRVVGRADMIDPGKSGYLFPCGDVPALAALLRQTLSSRALLDQLRAGVLRQMESWTAEDYADSFFEGIELAWSRKRR